MFFSHQNVNSDVDIMILVTLTDDEIREIRDEVSDFAFELLMKYQIDISPIIKNVSHFNYWSDTLPYYKAIRKEGVLLSA